MRSAPGGCALLSPPDRAPVSVVVVTHRAPVCVLYTPGLTPHASLPSQMEQGGQETSGSFLGRSES